MAVFGFITRFAAKVLAVDSTSLPEQQLAMIQDVLVSQKDRVQGKEAKELLTCLKRKHLVNSITLHRFKDRLVFSSSGNGMQESKRGTEVVDFVKRNFENTDIVTLRTGKEWIMLMPLQSSLYVVKANSTLSTVELRALAKEIESVFKKKHLS